MAGRGNVIAMRHLKNIFPHLNLDVPGESNWSPIVNSCFFGQLESVRYLHEQQVNIKPNLGGRTLAHMAGIRTNPKESLAEFPSKRAKLINFLESIGIDLNAVDKKGRTYRDFMTFDLGISPDVDEPLGRNLLHWASYTVFAHPVKIAKEAEVKALFADPISVKALDIHDKSPIMYSVTNNTPEGEAVFRQLLPLSDLFAKDINQRTVLHWACGKSKNSAIVTTLLESGLDPFAEDVFGQNAFDIAFNCECHEVLTTLQEHTLKNTLKSALSEPAAPATFTIGTPNPTMTQAYYGQRAAGDTDADIVTKAQLDAINTARTKFTHY